MTGFWEDTWELEDALSRPGDAEDGSSIETAARLHSSLVQEHFFLVYRGFSDPSWFPAFKSAGLFLPRSEPVNVWPSAWYLAAIAGTLPNDVCDVLLDLPLHVEPSVATGSLKAAAQLPPSQAASVIPHALAQWEQSGGWLSLPVLQDLLLSKIAVLEEDDQVIAIGRLIRRGLATPQDSYAMQQLLSPDKGMEVADALSSRVLADAIELGLATAGESRTASYVSLEQVSSETSFHDPMNSILDAWCRAVEREWDAGRFRSLAARAARLSVELDHLGTQQARRALRLALETSEPDPLAIQLLASAFTAATASPSLGPEGRELRMAIAAGWPHALTEWKAQLLSTLVLRGQSGERRDKWDALAWLDALAEVTGPKEDLLRQALGEELGLESATQAELPEPKFRFVGPLSVLTGDEIQSSTMDELIGWMAFPNAGDQTWGEPSAEGLGRELEPELTRRVDEVVANLHTIAVEVSAAAIHIHVLRSITVGFKGTSDRTRDNLSRIVAYVSLLSTRSDLAEDEWATSDNVLGACAGLIEDLADWFALVPDSLTQPVLDVLRRALDSPDPTQSTEESFGGSNMDPPTLALNSTRGRGLRAVVWLLAACWSSESPDELVEGLNAIVIHHASAEQSPSVRSVFGFHLPWLLERVPSSNLEALLLPQDDSRASQWDATFGTYVLFRSATQLEKLTLKRHYLRAIDLGAQSNAPFLASHGDRLASHFLSFWLGEDEDLGSMQTLSACLDAIGDDDAAGAVGALAQSLLAERVQIAAGRVLALVRGRAPGAGSAESSALLNALFASRVAVTSALPLVSVLSGRASRPDLEDCLEYLVAADSRRTKTGARILSLMVATAAHQPWIEISAVKTLAESYVSTAPSEVADLSDMLGSGGWYDVEDLARAARAVLSESN